MFDKIESYSDISNKAASYAEMVYIMPAMISAYAVDGSEFVEYGEIAQAAIEELCNKNAKDADINSVTGVVCKLTKLKAKNLAADFECIKDEALDFRELEDAINKIIQSLEIKSEYQGIIIKGNLPNIQDTILSFKAHGYTRGFLRSEIRLEGSADFFANIISKSALAKHEVPHIRIEINASKDDKSLSYIEIIRQNELAKAAIYGKGYGCRKIQGAIKCCDLGKIIRSL